MYSQTPCRGRFQRGFTLIELLVVLGIISIMMAAVGATIGTMMTNARENRTIATLRKIDGLLVERQQGLERAYNSRAFRRYVDDTRESLIKGDPTNGVPQLFGLSEKAVEAAARKNFARDLFPQRFAEMTDVLTKAAGGAKSNGPDGIPDRIQFDSVYGNLVTWTGTAPNVTPVNHDPLTESAELLYFAITRMEVFGAAPVASDQFSTDEVTDVDGDGLPEFIDGWGQPLRFYRWPTRLFKPYGLYGRDGAPGVAGTDDDGVGGNDNVSEIGWPGSDDAVIDSGARFVAGFYMTGLPRQPVMYGSPPRPVAGDYDMLNEDPDDSFGVLLSESIRLTASGILMLDAVTETRFHTLDTFHRPLVVSVGADGVPGLYEPGFSEDTNLNGVLDSGEDRNGNGLLDVGWLAQPINEDTNRNGVQDGSETDLNGNADFDSMITPVAAFDDLTNRNRRAGD